MSRRRAGAAYTRLATEEEHENGDNVDGPFVDEQFVEPKRTFPWKTVLFVIFFLIIGTVCLSCSILTHFGFLDPKYEDRILPLLLLGILMLIPGGYYGYMLICITFGRNGFTVEDIPML